MTLSGSFRTVGSRFTGKSKTPPTSRPRPPASRFAATSRSSICSPNSRPTAWVGNTSSGCSNLLPPSDFAEGLLNSHARPEGNGHVVITSTEADQGNLVPMELMKRLLEAKGLPGAVMFHDVRWGSRHDGRFLWVLLNSGSCGAYAFNHDVTSLDGVHSFRQPAGYFPVPGGTFAGVSLPGAITWARCWIDRGGQLVMDLGRGESVALPEDVREDWWRGTTRQWPFMAADLGCSMETDHGPLYEQPCRCRLRRHPGRDDRPLAISRLSGPYSLGVTEATRFREMSRDHRLFAMVTEW